MGGTDSLSTDELLRRWERCTDDAQANRLRDILKQRGVHVAERWPGRDTGVARPGSPAPRHATGPSPQLRRRWLAELETPLRAQPQLNERLEPMTTRERARQLVSLFVSDVRVGEPLDPRLVLYIAWALKSPDPARALGLKLGRPGNPDAESKLTPAEREEHAQRLAQAIATAPKRKRGKRSGDARHHGLGSERGLGSVQTQAIDSLSDELRVDRRTVETMLAEEKERERQARRLTGEVVGGPEKSPDPLPVPADISLVPMDLLRMLEARCDVSFVRASSAPK